MRSKSSRGEADAQAARDRQEVDDGVGGAADGGQGDDRVVGAGAGHAVELRRLDEDRSLAPGSHPVDGRRRYLPHRRPECGPADGDRQRAAALDKTTWREAAFPGAGEPGVRLNAVAVGADRQVWICGSRGGGGLLYGDGGGAEWRWLDPLPVASANLYRVVVRPSGEVWVGGDQSNGGGWSGLVARWDGAWTVLPPLAGLRLGIARLHAAGPDDVWAVGTEARIGGPPGRPGNPALSHWDGTAWTRVDAGFTVGSLSGIAGDAQGRAAWISGWNYQDQTRRTYLRRDGDTWTAVRGPAAAAPAPYLDDVTSVPGTAGFWSVGMTSPTPAPPTEACTERLEA